MYNYFKQMPKEALEAPIKPDTTFDVETFFYMKNALETALQYIDKEFYAINEQEAKDLNLLHRFLSTSIDDTVKEVVK
jgi:hypothetical protein